MTINCRFYHRDTEAQRQQNQRQTAGVLILLTILRCYFAVSLLRASVSLW